MMGLSVFAGAYAAVLVAEIAGDKLMYTSAVLATRYRLSPVLFGMALAFMAKMGVAVALGGAISELPPIAVAIVTALSFASMAYLLWHEPVKPVREASRDLSLSKGAFMAFTAIFLSEWGDIGQIMAATFTARYGAPLIVWTAAVCAMVTKGALAVSIGAALRQWMQRHVAPETLRYSSVLIMVILGIASVAEELGMDF